MQTKNIEPVSDPTLTKLLAVDSDLAAQEAQLIIQLQDIQAKRRSLEIVISLFSVDDAQAAPATKTAEGLPTQQVAVDETGLVAPLPEASTTPALSSEQGRQQQRVQPRKAERTQAAARQPKGTRRSTSTPASSRKSESWRSYVREGFEASAALPKIVSQVLQRLPDRVLTVPEIMNAIFVGEIPKEARKKVHQRLLSALSHGVKENQWQRSDKGQYTISALGAEVEEVQA
ncbi:hypothetical protein AVDCRST_MAG94-1825 [uncultured Leptolyngbya sp.]|uniref:Uncharacterized protein n=1 Tax=uncultured Leptolyngbya sp. TaxID=332963 RepID=A0A6J4LCH2_9CYAN|nr:hypothetical protein AVDCRST_MAG94-1825 [uncultured Leptolyngbya sp.]